MKASGSAAEANNHFRIKFQDYAGRSQVLMHIEAITVCVDYADFLRETLPYNMKHFNHYVVITSPDDHETQELCACLGVECRKTDVIKQDGVFAKTRGVDLGLGFLERKDWVVHLDADVWLPPSTRHWFEWTKLNLDCIYGIDRCNCTGWEAWKAFRDRGEEQLQQHHRGCLTVPPPFPLGARISLREYGGYVPIGFFQMWNAAKHDHRYPFRNDKANCTDVMHSLQWPGENRRLIPEIIGVHIDSGSGSMGENWNGRKTPRFGPKTEPTADAAYHS
jgi:hypothetical protein